MNLLFYKSIFLQKFVILTPSSLIGEQEIPGLIPLKELERLVEKVRLKKNE